MTRPDEISLITRVGGNSSVGRRSVGRSVQLDRARRRGSPAGRPAPGALRSGAAASLIATTAADMVYRHATHVRAWPPGRRWHQAGRTGHWGLRVSAAAVTESSLSPIIRQVQQQQQQQQQRRRRTETERYAESER